VEGGIRGGGRHLAVRGGRTRWRGARGVVESVKERLERAVCGGTPRVGRSSGEGSEGLSGLELEGSQRCTGGGGARGGDSRARWWPEEAVLGEPGCGSQRRHEARRKQRWGVSARWRSKRGSSSVGRSPYSRTRRWPRAAEPLGGEVVGAGKRWWPLFEGGQHGLTQLAHGLDRETDTRGSHGFFIILEFPNRLNSKKIKISALTCSKNSQFLHVGITGYYEHFCQLCQHPFPNRSSVKNPGTN
jgi:hypothetical protein